MSHNSYLQEDLAPRRLHTKDIFSHNIVTQRIWIQSLNGIVVGPENDGDPVQSVALTPTNEYMVGASPAPYQTIQSAVDAAVATALYGGRQMATILVMDGTYTETVTLSPGMHVKAVNKHAPLLIGGFTMDAKSVEDDMVYIEGMTIVCNTAGGACIETTLSASESDLLVGVLDCFLLAAAPADATSVLLRLNGGTGAGTKAINLILHNSRFDANAIAGLKCVDLTDVKGIIALSQFYTTGTAIHWKQGNDLTANLPRIISHCDIQHEGVTGATHIIAATNEDIQLKHCSISAETKTTVPALTTTSPCRLRVSSCHISSSTASGYLASGTGELELHYVSTGAGESRAVAPTVTQIYTHNALSVRTYSGAFPITMDKGPQRCVVTTNGGGVVNMPLATECRGQSVLIKNRGDTAISLTPNGAELINGVNAAVTINPDDSLELHSLNSGGGWITTSPILTSYATLTGSETLTNKTIPGYATLTGSETLTNKTISSSEVRFTTGEGIYDSSGNEILLFGENANAVNYLQFNNSATGDAIEFGPKGSDANIHMHWIPKGTGMFHVAGDMAVSQNPVKPTFWSGEHHLQIGESTNVQGTWTIFNYKDANNPFPMTGQMTEGQTYCAGPISNGQNGIYFYYRNAGGTWFANAAHGGAGFTGQHSKTGNPDGLDAVENKGLIVEADGTHASAITINDAWPNARLSDTPMSKRVYGVVTCLEANTTKPAHGYMDHEQVNFDNDVQMNQIRVNSIGEGAIYVSNFDGNFENGDYITTCTVPGYGTKQTDDILHSYTVAKITQDCDFSSPDRYVKGDGTIFADEAAYNAYVGSDKYKVCFVGCTYHCG